MQVKEIQPITGNVMAHIIGLTIVVIGASLAYLVFTDWLGRWMASRRYRKQHRRRRGDQPKGGG